MKRYLSFGLMIATMLVISLNAASQSKPAKTKFTLLHSFVGGASDGQSPFAGLILDAAGNLYGTTALGGGGVSDCCGTVFKIDPNGNRTVLYFFGSNGDGINPEAGLLLDAQGNLFGTTYAGGDSGTGCGGYGCGTVFKLTPEGKEQVLYSFSGGADGGNPEAGLTLGLDGRLYGTTYMGGAYNWGTVFAVDGSGVESVIHSFAGAAPDGGEPQSGLISDASGNFYGMTFAGDNPACLPNLPIGCGTIYKITAAGVETVLYGFTGQKDGFWPGGSLVADGVGNLYGTSQGQGGKSGYGTVFKLDSSGKFTVLHKFAGGTSGSQPWAGLVRDAADNLYGTTLYGGGTACYDGCGTVFELQSSGKFSLLHRFTGGADGANPMGALVMDASGNLYGTTLNGGLGDGVVFKITH